MKKGEMTKVEKINHIMSIEAVQADEIAMEYLKNELQLIENRKNGFSEKNQKKQAENEKLKDEIYKLLNKYEDGKTAAFISSNLDGEISTQKVVAMMTKLLAEDKVERVRHKGIVYFIVKEKAKKWVSGLMQK